MSPLFLIMNPAAKDIVYNVVVPFGDPPRSGLAGSPVAPRLLFWGSTRLLYEAAAPFYVPAGHGQG